MFRRGDRRGINRRNVGGGRLVTPLGILGSAGLTWLRSDLGVTATTPAFTSPSDLTNAAWTKENVTVGATQITDSNDAGPVIHRVYQQPANTAVAHAYAFSVDLKAGTKSWAQLRIAAASTAYVNLATGAVGATAGNAAVTTTSLGGGWWRVRIAIPAADCVTHTICQVYTANGDSLVSYQGDGTGTIFAQNATAEQALVTAWADQSGNAHNVAQALAVQKPDWQVNTGKNGLPGITFDGVASPNNDFLRGTWTWNQPAHIWIVAKMTALVATATYCDGSAINTLRLYDSGAGNLGLHAGLLIQKACTYTNWNFIEARTAAGNGYLNINGSGSPVTGAIGAGNPGGLIVGSSGAQTTSPCAMIFCEYIGSETVRSAAEVARIQDYLITRYGAF